MPTSNVRQLTDNGVPVYPITERSLVIGLHESAFATYVMAWDGASTPVPANIPAGVVVTYNGTNYTGTLAASASTAQDLYLVASASQQGEYDRYITTHTGSTYAWNPVGSTAIVSPVIADDLVTNDPSKALSAKQGKILGDKTSELEAEVNGKDDTKSVTLSITAGQVNTYNTGDYATINLKAGIYNLLFDDTIVKSDTQLWVKYAGDNTWTYIDKFENLSPVTFANDVSVVGIWAVAAQSLKTADLVLTFSDTTKIVSVDSRLDALEAIEGGQFDLYGTVVDGYIDSDGFFHNDAVWNVSPYYPVYPGMQISYKLYANSAVSAFTFYDSKFNLISANPLSGSGNKEGVYTVPSGVAFVRVSGHAKSNDDGEHATVTLNVNNYKMLNDVVRPPVAYDLFGTVTDGYIDNLGIFHNDSNWNVSPFLPVIPGMKIQYKLYVLNVLSSFTFYDSQYKLVSANPITGSGNVFGTYTVPAGASFVRVSGHAKSNNDGEFAIIEVDTDIYKMFLDFVSPPSPLLPIEHPKKAKLVLKETDNIVLYGDSISSTDYPWYKEWMEMYCGGVTVNNNGASGYTAAQLAADAQLNNRIFAYNPNLIVVLIGGNDTGATVGTFGAVNSQPTVAEPDISSAYSGTYFIQAISYIMQKLKAYYYDIITRSEESVPIDMEDEGEVGTIDALCRPYIAFATSLPRNVGAYEIEANVRNKRNAIVECCNKYGIHCIDLTYLTGIDWTQEPIKSGTTDKVNSYGIYTMDGLHPNKWGYERMVQVICGEINVIVQ